jgi:hypothetical protein
VLVASAVVPPAAICPMPALDLTLSASLRTAHRLARLPAPALAAAVVLGAAALVSAFIAIAIALALMVPAAVGLALPTRQCLRQEVCGCA